MSKGKFLKESMLTPELLERLKGYNAQAQQRHETLAEMALAWVLQHPGVTSVIVGASSTEQLQKNLKSVNAAAFDTNL
jgi:L-glyceraldehyde 3-phosphate reductase